MIRTPRPEKESKALTPKIQPSYILKVGPPRLPQGVTLEINVLRNDLEYVLGDLRGVVDVIYEQLIGNQ